MNHQARFLALTVGAVVGLVLGLAYAWLIEPVKLYNTTPALLREDYRHEWVRLAALGYVADGDMDRALVRLGAVPAPDVQAALAAQIEAYAIQGKPASLLRPLSRLADRLGVRTPAMAVYLAELTPAPTILPTPSFFPASSPSPTRIFLPTPTATPTPFLSPLPIPSLYRVISQTQLCTGTVPILQVWVQAVPEQVDEEEKEAEPTPLPGVALWLTWPGGADRAVTGLRPEIDPGYADFTLQPDTPYALSVDVPDAPVLSGLQAQPCPDGERPGGWQLVIQVTQ